MSTAALISLGAIVLVATVSTIIGAVGVRMTRSTSNFLVASRNVGPVANATAISGEYLSAASFLGIAGIILQQGADGLWYPLAFVGGYLALLLFVAAPLRRSGAYTVPDFAEARLGSIGLRRVSTFFVLLIGLLYLMAQLQGAGLALTTMTQLPSWVGVVTAAVIVLVTVVGGGMRSITFVQAFQYWVKVTAVLVPVLVIGGVFLSDTRDFDTPSAPRFTAPTTITVRTDVTLQVVESVIVTADGTVDDVDVAGSVIWQPGPHTVTAGTDLNFPADAPIPVVAGAAPTQQSWLESAAQPDPNKLLEVYSILIAGFLGTMGLPHVLVRFYTNPDGRTARRTTLLVLAMIGVFYVLINALGALSRLYVPTLLVNGDTDAAVLLLPSAALGDNHLGWVIAAVLAAGTAAAFLSTSSGLVMSMAGVLFTDVVRGRWQTFRLAAALAAVVPMLAALGVARLDLTVLVPLAFAVAASTFCPLLLLGIWWRNLTAPAAIAGVVVGGGLSGAASIVSLLVTVPDTWYGVLLHRPAVVTVPLAFLVMIVVGLATRRRVPADVDRTMLRLHAPDRLGLSPERLDGPSGPTGR